MNSFNKAIWIPFCALYVALALASVPCVLAADCAGDCNASADISVDELITLVNIALGDAGVDDCPVGDVNGDGRISVDELVGAVGLALVGCGANGDRSCGFSEPASATIDVSERNDVFHGRPFSRVEASLREGVNPSFHEVFMEEGQCRYLKAKIGNCDPPCISGETCSADDECVVFPEGISGGTLTITGLGDPLELSSADFSPGTYIGPAGLPNPLFAAGDPIKARLSGGDFPAVGLGANGVAQMDTELTASGFEMLDGEDALLAWTPGPDADVCIDVVINGFNAAHGAPLADIIVCRGTDTGSIEIPRSFVEEFPHGATPVVTEGHDWPHSELTRYTRNSVDTEQGRAELVVRSTTYFQLSHPE